MKAEETTITGITGVTFPVPKQFMHRFFSGGKIVFVKMATSIRLSPFSGWRSFLWIK
ncbi:hypothetical protein [Methanocalculus natronophilus]|uniref:hypothetical protein n=1 Tax=Methanocalculus natronophilus TaxID=1262400 RepID=UPI0031B5D1D3